MSIIAAGTTTTTALSSTGNTDGTLQFQVNGTTPSVTLNTLGAVGVGSTPGYGTSGQVLTSAGSTAAPTWSTNVSSQWTTTGSDIYYNTGNVGIGTSSPSSKLSVYAATGGSTTGFTVNASGNMLNLFGSSSTNAGVIFNATDGTVGSATGVPILWRLGGSEKMRLDTSGNLGLGTSSPSFKLDISGDGSTAKINTLDTYDGGASLSTWMKVGRRAGTGTNAYINTLHSGSDAVSALTFAFGTTSTGTEVVRISSAGGFSVGTTADPGAGAIYATGNITAYYSSDIKFKENVRDIPDALATVNAIGGKLFDWTDEYIESKGGADGYFVQKADFGVVAQDVQKVFPIAVRTRDDGSLAVDYEKLGALAFAALVELTKRVEALEAK